MAEITINGRIKVKSFQNAFLKEFPFLVPTMRTKDGKGIDNDLTIASARSIAIGGDYTPSGESDLSVNGNLTVRGFEDRFEKAFGFTCEICFQKSGRMYKTTENYDSMTLASANKKLKEDGAEEIKL